MVKKVISLSVIFVLLLTEITVDFHYLKGIHFSGSRVYADTATPYCLPTNDGTKTGTFSQETGYCVLDPEDSAGKCLSPYVYSTEYKKCVSMPLCPGLYVWNSQTKQCESVSASPSGGTEPTFPENSCAVDINGNGEIEQNEIHQCQQTPQGYICPVGQTQCNPQYEQPTCPAQYTYNPQTQKCEYTPQVGVCSSQQVQTTQYQCPTSGQVYSDLNQCNSACIQTAQCNVSRVCSAQVSCCVIYRDSGCEYYTATGSTSPGSQIYLDAGFYCGSMIRFNSECYIYSFSTRYTFNFSISPGSCIFVDNFLHVSYNTSNNCYPCPQSYWCFNPPVDGMLEFSVRNISPPPSYTCPLPGGSACTGNPPTCTAGQACVTYDSTVTKWQCSLNGVQYDTQDQCTTSCYSGCPSGGTFNPSTGKCEATATCQNGTLQSQGCFTGYGCPLGQYQCQDVNGTWMCSPYQCITSSQLQDEGDVIPSGYEDDGPKDEEGNCLGTIYIFNGKGMRCRKSGVQTGFHNCCNESQGKLYDSTGSVGGGIGVMKEIPKVISAVYTAVNLSYRGMQGGVLIVNPAEKTATFYGANGYRQTFGATSPESNTLQSVTPPENVTVLPDGQIAYTIPPGGDELAARITQTYIREVSSQLALIVVNLAVSQIVKDPVLSSAINLVATCILNPNPVGIASAVVTLAMSLFQKRCDQQDIMTSTFNDSKYCHEVGEYCIKKWPLVGCVQKAKGFCCFNSKLARIIHEQGRPQLAGFGVNSWGDPKNPNCRGFLPEEFQALDFNKIDLSEYIEDIQRNIRQNLAPQLQQQIQQSWGR